MVPKISNMDLGSSMLAMPPPRLDVVPLTVVLARIEADFASVLGSVFRAAGDRAFGACPLGPFAFSAFSTFSDFSVFAGFSFCLET